MAMLLFKKGDYLLTSGLKSSYCHVDIRKKLDLFRIPVASRCRDSVLRIHCAAIQAGNNLLSPNCCSHRFVPDNSRVFK